MARRRGKLRRTPEKEEKLARRAEARSSELDAARRVREALGEAAFRYVAAIRWAVEREAGLYPFDAGVVCLACGLEQPYDTRSGCARGALLDLPCGGVEAVTAEAFADGFAPGHSPEGGVL